MAELVSVVIPCYNHGKYLSRAIESVLYQTHAPVEVIVVDDGSVDDTADVARGFPQVKYIHQANQGLSAARNTGIDQSAGKYLLFLDADDWLFPEAITTNLQYLRSNADAGFVSGGFTLVKPGGLRDEVARTVRENHYLHLLRGNYIAMHATVLYRRDVFAAIRYDPALKGCEDYDIYLRIARCYPVLHHTKQIAVYMIHDTNMSGNIPLMLETALLALEKQRPLLKNDAEKAAFRDGQLFWTNHFLELIITFLLNSEDYQTGGRKAAGISMLKHYRKKLYYKYLIIHPFMAFKRTLIRSKVNFLLRWLYKAGMYPRFVPSHGKVIKGDFDRPTPFSTNFGFERGGAVDRYYIENFLEENRVSVKGRVLEIGDNAYTMRFGGANITKSDVLHIEEGHPQATFYGDLSDAPQISDNLFDCIILTQTLQFIYHYKEALETCFRVLKPGGKLLLTVPGISHIDHGEWKEIWFWSFTKSSITRLLSDIFSAENTVISTFGNVQVASSFLYGLGLPEMTKKQLDHNDPHYQVIITAVATKPVR